MEDIKGVVSSTAMTITHTARILPGVKRADYATDEDHMRACSIEAMAWVCLGWRNLLRGDGEARK